MAMVMAGDFAAQPGRPITGRESSIISSVISTGGLFPLVGVVYERRHTREISDTCGLSK